MWPSPLASAPAAVCGGVVPWAPGGARLCRSATNQTRAEVIARGSNHVREMAVTSGMERALLRGVVAAVVVLV